MKDSRYEEALERARQGLPIDKIFPELYESEDERIRTVLCDIVRDMPYMETELRAHGLSVEKTIAYLERQKEQKPDVKDPFDDEQFRNGYEAGKHDAMREQKPEWSDEDEDYMNAIITIINRETTLYPKGGATENFNNDLIAWLKSLRPSWKPSEEQMEALMLAIEGKCAPTSYMSRRLEDLYEALANEFHVECKFDK